MSGTRPGQAGGSGNKFARVLVSEIVGVDALAGVRTSSRIDPLGIEKGDLYEGKDGGWVVAKADAKTEKVKVKEDGKEKEIDELVLFSARKRTRASHPRLTTAT